MYIVSHFFVKVNVSRETFFIFFKICYVSRETMYIFLKIGKNIYV